MVAMWKKPIGTICSEGVKQELQNSERTEPKWYQGEGSESEHAHCEDSTAGRPTRMKVRLQVLCAENSGAVCHSKKLGDQVKHPLQGITIALKLGITHVGDTTLYITS